MGILTYETWETRDSIAAGNEDEPGPSGIHRRGRWSEIRLEVSSREEALEIFADRDIHVTRRWRYEDDDEVVAIVEASWDPGKRRIPGAGDGRHTTHSQYDG